MAGCPPSTKEEFRTAKKARAETSEAPHPEPPFARTTTTRALAETPSETNQTASVAPESPCAARDDADPASGAKMTPERRAKKTEEWQRKRLRTELWQRKDLPRK